MNDIDLRLWAVQIEQDVMDTMRETARDGAREARQSRVSVIKDHLADLVDAIRSKGESK